MAAVNPSDIIADDFRAIPTGPPLDWDAPADFEEKAQPRDADHDGWVDEGKPTERFIGIRRPKVKAKLNMTRFDGEKGNRTHITAEEQGTIPIEAIANLPGRNGEIPGTHRNRPGDGESWEEFLANIDENGITDSIFIMVAPGEPIRIDEGNHRRDAALELGLDKVPVEIRYLGKEEEDGTLMERWERGELDTGLPDGMTMSEIPGRGDGRSAPGTDFASPAARRISHESGAYVDFEVRGTEVNVLWVEVPEGGRQKGLGLSLLSALDDLSGDQSTLNTAGFDSPEGEALWTKFVYRKGMPLGRLIREPRLDSQVLSGEEGTGTVSVIHTARGSFVEKAYPWDTIPADTFSENEQYAVSIAQALGVKTPEILVADDTENGQTYVYSEFIPRVPGSKAPAHTPAAFAVPDGPEQEAAYKRIAMFDFLTQNTDRHQANSLVTDDGEVWAIDHSHIDLDGAFPLDTEIRGPAESWIDYHDGMPVHHGWSREELDEHRKAITDIPSAWVDNYVRRIMLERLDSLYGALPDEPQRRRGTFAERVAAINDPDVQVEVLTDPSRSGEGGTALVELIRTSAGPVIRKEYPAGDRNARSDHEIAFEIEGSYIARSLGVNTPEITRTDTFEVVVDLVPSSPGGDEPAEDLNTADFDWETADQRDDWHRIALVDFLTQNIDRHDGNMLLDDQGDLWAIDTTHMHFGDDHFTDLHEDRDPDQLFLLEGPAGEVIPTTTYRPGVPQQVVDHAFTMEELQGFKETISQYPETIVPFDHRMILLERLELLIKSITG